MAYFEIRPTGCHSFSSSSYAGDQAQSSHLQIRMVLLKYAAMNNLSSEET